MIKDDTMDKIDELMTFLQKFIKTNGYPPSTREICSNLSIKSTATAHYYLEKAVSLGYIKKTASKNRTIELCSPYSVSNNVTNVEKVESFNDNVVNIPLVGKVAAGNPITAVENIEDNVSVSQGFFRGNDLFMLRVSGNSMIDIGIFDGDLVVIKQQNTCNDGDIIVAMVDDEATLKRFYLKDDHIVLHPENSMLNDIIVTQDQSFAVLGKLVGSIRQF